MYILRGKNPEQAEPALPDSLKYADCIVKEQLPGRVFSWSPVIGVRLAVVPTAS